MNTLVDDLNCTATVVKVGRDALTIVLADGRQLTVPLAWYPRLLHGTSAERRNFQFIGGGLGIHWSDLDEDISVEGLLAGRHSQEKPESLRQWLKQRLRKNGKNLYPNLIARSQAAKLRTAHR